MTDLLSQFSGGASPEQPDDLDAEFRRVAEARRATILRQAGDPETVSRANVLAREKGLPPTLVEQHLPTFEGIDRASRANEMMARYPAVGKWAADPRRLAAASDDHDALGKIAAAFDPAAWQRKRASNEAYWQRALAGNGSISAAPQPAPTLMNSIRGVVTEFVQSAARQREGLRIAFADWADFLVPKPAPGAPSLGDFTIPNAIQRYDRAAGKARAARPAFKSSTAAGAYSGVASIAQMLPALAASVATRNPQPVIGALGAQSGIDAYGKYRARGGTRGEAALGGVLEGGIEAGTEMLPMGFLVNKLGKVGAGKFLSGYLGREMLTEQVATFAQDAVDTAIANPEKTWAEFRAERPDAAYQTAIATLITSGAFATASHVSDRMTRRAEAIVDARAGAALLDRLSSAVGESKTTVRDPQALAELIRNLGEGAGVQNIFIPAEAVQAYHTADADNDYFGGNTCPWRT